MFSKADLAASTARVRQAALVLACLVLPLLGLYIWALKAHSAAASYALILALWLTCAFYCGLRLLPELRYWQFLCRLQKGLRRQTRGTLVSLGAQTQLRDGARMREAALACAGEDEARIFYFNGDHPQDWPPLGAQVCITSCGRCATAWAAQPIDEGK